MVSRLVRSVYTPHRVGRRLLLLFQNIPALLHRGHRLLCHVGYGSEIALVQRARVFAYGVNERGDVGAGTRQAKQRARFRGVPDQYLRGRFR